MSNEMPTPEELAEIQSAQGADSVFDEKGMPRSTESAPSVEGQIEKEIAHEEQVLQQNLGEFLPKLSAPDGLPELTENKKNSLFKSWESWRGFKEKVKRYGLVSSLGTGLGALTTWGYYGEQAVNMRYSGEMFQKIQEYAALMDNAEYSLEKGAMAFFIVSGASALTYLHSVYKERKAYKEYETYGKN